MRLTTNRNKRPLLAYSDARGRSSECSGAKAKVSTRSPDQKRERRALFAALSVRLPSRKLLAARCARPTPKRCQSQLAVRRKPLARNSLCPRAFTPCYSALLRVTPRYSAYTRRLLSESSSYSECANSAAICIRENIAPANSS